MKPRGKAGSLATLAALSTAMGLAGAACAPGERCAIDGTPCGGSPVGDWMVVYGCRDPIYQPPLPLTLLQQPKGTARELPPEQTSSDWCSYLTLGPNGVVTSFQFPYDALGIGGGVFNYKADGTYSARVVTSGPGAVDLTASCLQAFAAAPTCQQLQTALVDFAATLGTVRDISCSDGPESGCHCTYNLIFTASYNGSWSFSAPGLMNHFDANKLLPSQVDYCVSPDRNSMTLWGHNRTSILDVIGVRTLNLGPLGI
jgi:hypothetical protein